MKEKKKLTGSGVKDREPPLSMRLPCPRGELGHLLEHLLFEEGEKTRKMLKKKRKRRGREREKKRWGAGEEERTNDGKKRRGRDGGFFSLFRCHR